MKINQLDDERVEVDFGGDIIPFELDELLMSHEETLTYHDKLRKEISDFIQQKVPNKKNFTELKTIFERDFRRA